MWCPARIWPLVCAFAAAGCGAESWTPAAPAGVTWRYEHQGFHDRSTTVVAGSIRGPAAALNYGGVFAFRDEVGVSMGTAADPFAESTPIDGIRFNEHLAGQGRILAPAPGAASAAAPPAPGPSPAGSAPRPAGSAAPAGEP